MSDKTKRIVRKYYEFVVTKFKILREQKIFHYNDVNVKYILKEKKETNALVVVFSACTRKGLKARYNYVKTLDGMECSRLYILDDYAKDHRGSYYLGENFQFNEEKATDRLIQNVLNDLQPDKIIFCGSSKGGYAALNFGVQYPMAHIIVGAPQYFLASYLEQSGNLDALLHILGERNVQKEEELDDRLCHKICDNKNYPTQHVYIHYSNKEHTYEEHVVHLLKDLEKSGYQIVEDIADYTNHGDLSYYFPDFLKKNIADILNNV